MESGKNSYFTRHLLKWNDTENSRKMPWKGEKDPYKIWLSEIILQQTRVEQGLGYYNRFITRFPTVKSLAAADETAVFKLWEGLGYYSRCRNLVATAKIIAHEFNGNFPGSYDSIIKLKGIGPYTAAAIASFAFNLPHAVVDGNVMRVLARYFGIALPIDSTAGKNHFTKLANTLLDKKGPARYNQAIMDFGATICKPRQPFCTNCLLREKCTAYRSNTVESYPVKENRLIKKDRWFYYVVASCKNSFYIRKRGHKDIWQNLHEFILFERNEETPIRQIAADPVFISMFGPDADIQGVSEMYRQQLTHQTIYGTFIEVKLNKKISIEGYELHGKSTISKMAFPRLINNYFEKEKQK